MYARAKTYSPPPQKKVVYRYCTDAKPITKVFVHPIRFLKGWDDRKSGGARDGSFWFPVCPANFIPMSSVAIHIGNGAVPNYKHFLSFRCLHRSFTIQTGYGPIIWTDAGSGASYNAKLFAINGSPYFHTQLLNGHRVTPVFKVKPVGFSNP